MPSLCDLEELGISLWWGHHHRPGLWEKHLLFLV